MISQFLHRQKYRFLNNNPLVWYKKLFQARRIYYAKPQPVPPVADLEIHVLACSKDFLCLLWALRSFYYYSRKIASLRIHDDGSLKSRHFHTLDRLFPGCQILPKSQSDKEINEFLTPYPKCQRCRQQSIYMIKVFDFFYYSQSERLVLLDSDVLFFEDPIDLHSPNSWSVFNSDVWTSYVYSTAEIKSRFGCVVPEKINIGLGALDKKCFNLDVLERLMMDEKLMATPFITDQTLIAILAPQNEVRLLGPEYKLSLSRGLTNTVSKHYTRLVRHLFWLEGIPHLVASGILR
jgi:hypothetical protein